MKSPIESSFKSELLPILMVILSILLGFYFYPRFPAKVAIHWNFQGQVNGYSGRIFGAFGLPVIITALYLMFLVIPRVDPKQERYPEFSSIYRTFKSLIIGFMLFLYLITGLFNLGIPLPIGTIIPILIGVLMISIGNFMGKIKPNWFIGIRTPWTLSSETVWNKTHRMGRYIFILFGIIICITPFLGRTLGTVILAIGLIMLISGTFLYSFLIYRQERNESQPTLKK